MLKIINKINKLPLSKIIKRQIESENFLKIVQNNVYTKINKLVLILVI